MSNINLNTYIEVMVTLWDSEEIQILKGNAKNHPFREDVKDKINQRIARLNRLGFPPISGHYVK